MISNENIKRVAIYLRLSRDEENKGIEKILANHREKLINLCEKNNWKYDIYEEIASSNNMLREQMNEMLSRIQTNEYDGVVCHAIDRLSRNEFDAVEIKRILYTTDTLIITPDKIYDWEKDGDMLLLGIQTLMAAQEYKMIKKRMNEGKLSASMKGCWVHGIPPLGYDKNPNTRLLEQNDKAQHVIFIFNAIIEGKTISEIYQELNRMGVKTRTGSEFTFNSILRIVNNEAYKGTIVSNRYDGKQKIRPQREWNFIENAHPAIINKEVWEKANKIVNTYSFSAPRSKNKIYPTTKLIYCGNCGKVQGTQKSSYGKLFIKMCSNCKNRAFSYTPILQLIKEKVIKRNTEILDLINHVKQNDNSPEIEYKKRQIIKQIQKAKVALEKLLPLYEEDLIDINIFKVRKAKREEEIDRLTFELEKVEQEDPKDKISDLNEMKNRIEYLRQNWECLDGDGLTDEDVNRSLHFIIEKINWTYSKGDSIPTLSIKYKE